MSFLCCTLLATSCRSDHIWLLAMSAFLLDREYGDAAHATTRVVLSGAYVGEGSLAWTATRVLSLLGWDGRTRNLEPDAGLRVELPKWGKWFMELGLDVNEHVCQSAKSLRARGKAVPENALPYASISTMGLYCVLCFYAARRNTVERMHSARVLLETLIGHCTNMPAANTLQSSVAERASCAESIDDSNQCVHLQEVCAGSELMEGSRPKLIAAVLARCPSRLSCPSCCMLATRVLRALATETETNSERWRSPNPEVAPELTGPTGKKRKIEPIKKELIRVSNTYTPGREHARSQFMASMLHAARESLSSPCTLSLSMDGGRIAKPKKEVNGAWIWLPHQRCSVFLPPKVCSLC
eukprot:6485439-Amphidinium_carterae.3